MLHLKAHLRILIREHWKMHKNMQKQIHFMLQLMIHFTVQLRGAPDSRFYSPPQDALGDLSKDVHKGACEIPRKGTLEVALESTCWSNY